MNETIIITFKSLSDFNSRIAKLWQDQKENQIYEFVFPDDETKEAFDNLMNQFHTEGQ